MPPKKGREIPVKPWGFLNRHLARLVIDE